MSAVTDQFNCERIQIAMLALQTDLAGVNIVHFDNDAQASTTSINRIVVEAMPREISSSGHSQQAPFLYSCKVKVSVKLAQNDPALLDTYVAAVQAANAPGVAAGSIITLATSLFGARGFDWYNVEDGERNDSPNERTATQMWEARFGA